MREAERDFHEYDQNYFADGFLEKLSTKRLRLRMILNGARENFPLENALTIEIGTEREKPLQDTYYLTACYITFAPEISYQRVNAAFDHIQTLQAGCAPCLLRTCGILLGVTHAVAKMAQSHPYWYKDTGRAREESKRALAKKFFQKIAELLDNMRYGVLDPFAWPEKEESANFFRGELAKRMKELVNANNEMRLAAMDFICKLKPGRPPYSESLEAAIVREVAYALLKNLSAPQLIELVKHIPPDALNKPD